jgi:hypothetical protein
MKDQGGQVLYLAKHRIRENAKVKYEDKVEVEVE